eukprot:6177513-Pleurochrysis_carterae.AAC.8
MAWRSGVGKTKVDDATARGGGGSRPGVAGLPDRVTACNMVSVEELTAARKVGGDDGRENQRRWRG